MDEHIPSISTANVYDTTEDKHLFGARIAADAVNSTHRVKRRRPAAVDRTAPDYHRVILDRGVLYAPDELVENSKPLPLKVPFCSREEVALPPLELLRALRYYAAQQGLPRGLLDESALLAFGMAVELWADEMVDGAALMFVEQQRAAQFAPPALELDGDAAVPDVDSDSDSDVVLVEVESLDSEGAVSPAVSPASSPVRAESGSELEMESASEASSESDTDGGSGSEESSEDLSDENVSDDNDMSDQIDSDSL